jgi:hypothetical protein
MRMTLRYAHQSPDQRFNAVKLLDDFVSKLPKTVSTIPSETPSETGRE